MRHVLPALALLSLLALAACDEGKPGAAAPAKPAGASTAKPAAALPEALFLSAAPEGAKDIKDAKPTLKTGDKVVLVGRIGGSEEPFVAQRAIFTLVDSHVKACGEDDPADKCKTPWDFCCEPRKELTANSVTVQITGPDGQPLKTDVENLKGLKHLAKVTVVGTIGTADAESGNVIVNATGLFIAQ